MDGIQSATDELRALIQDEKSEYEMDQALKEIFMNGYKGSKDTFEDRYEAWIEQMSEIHQTEGIAELYEIMVK